MGDRGVTTARTVTGDLEYLEGIAHTTLVAEASKAGMFLFGWAGGVPLITTLLCFMLWTGHDGIYVLASWANWFPFFIVYIVSMGLDTRVTRSFMRTLMYMAAVGSWGFTWPAYFKLIYGTIWWTPEESTYVNSSGETKTVTKETYL